jgi:hypothetical protein
VRQLEDIVLVVLGKGRDVFFGHEDRQENRDFGEFLVVIPNMLANFWLQTL